MNIMKGMNIDVANMTKTEKTVNEMSLELNMNMKLSNKFEETEHLEKINKSIQPYGLNNLGNSCYINSII